MPNTFIISRTDSIGDVVLTLPLAGILKHYFSGCKIVFIGNSYTKTIIELSKSVDFFVDKQDLITQKLDLKSFHASHIFFVFPDIEIAKLAKIAKISVRVGTSHRWYHWLYCTKLLHFSRKKSDLHEAELNLKLISFLHPEITKITKNEIANFYGFELNLQTNFELSSQKFNLILHPKSKGSAREWSIFHYQKLISLLANEKISIYITGTASEKMAILGEIPDFFSNSSAIDMMGKMTLSEFVEFINQADGLVACSTGPLHVAAALGKNAIGIYAPLKVLHPNRWAALGKNVKLFYKNEICSTCIKTPICDCVNSIEAQSIAKYIVSICKN